MLTAAHTQTELIRITLFYPDHSPRESDPHYHLFEAARNELKRLGRLVCGVCGTTEQVELHHSLIEFAAQNGIDRDKFSLLYPQYHILTDEDLYNFVESPENLIPLCLDHHRGAHGIHSLPYPNWELLRYWRGELPSPGVVIKGVSGAL